MEIAQSSMKEYHSKCQQMELQISDLERQLQSSKHEHEYLIKQYQEMEQQLKEFQELNHQLRQELEDMHALSKWSHHFIATCICFVYLQIRYTTLASTVCLKL